MNPQRVAQSLKDAKLEHNAILRFIAIIRECESNRSIPSDLRTDLVVASARDVHLKNKIETLAGTLLSIDDPSLDAGTIRAALATITLELVEAMEKNQSQLNNLLLLLKDIPCPADSSL